MVFDAREVAAKAEAEYPPFEFLGMDGREYVIPHPLMVDPATAKKALAAADGDAVLEIIAPEAKGAIDVMPIGVQRKLLRLWRETVGVDLDELGNEQAPPSPTTEPGRRLNPTSPSEELTSTNSGSGKSGDASTPSLPSQPPSSPEPSAEMVSP